MLLLQNSYPALSSLLPRFSQRAARSGILEEESLSLLWVLPLVPLALRLHKGFTGPSFVLFFLSPSDGVEGSLAQ